MENMPGSRTVIVVRGIFVAAVGSGIAVVEFADPVEIVEACEVPSFR